MPFLDYGLCRPLVGRGGTSERTHSSTEGWGKGAGGGLLRAVSTQRKKREQRDGVGKKGSGETVMGGMPHPHPQSQGPSSPKTHCTSPHESEVPRCRSRTEAEAGPGRNEHGCREMSPSSGRWRRVRPSPP